MVIKLKLKLCTSKLLIKELPLVIVLTSFAIDKTRNIWVANFVNNFASINWSMVKIIF